MAFPAGLGKLSIQSGIGQPLRAEIDVAATANELSTLTAKLAAPEAYKQAGMELTTSLSAIRSSVGKRPDGRSVLRLSSDRPINDPFLEMLIELNWATGRAVREYKVLLDPPEAVLARQAPPPLVARPTEGRPSTGGRRTDPGACPGSGCAAERTCGTACSSRSSRVGDDLRSAPRRHLEPDRYTDEV